MRGAILIIGSLLWDCRKERQRWRERRLRLDAKEHVQVPLEYGRRSNGRGNTFTMTFELATPQGQAVLVPCAAPTDRVEDLLKEAEDLWKAEQPNAAAGALGADWGCVGVQFRDSSHSWLKAWCGVFRERRTHAVSPVDDRGVLGIPWPLKTSGAATDVDFVLATATLKECSRPTAEAIANAWIQQSAGHERYFFENVRLGIRTHADVSIWKQIEEKAPAWLSTSHYAEAIAILKEEAVDGV